MDDAQYLMRELPYGSFTRTLRLPPLSTRTCRAKIADGVLTLRLPKAESAAEEDQHRFQVKAGFLSK